MAGIKLIGWNPTKRRSPVCWRRWNEIILETSVPVLIKVEPAEVGKLSNGSEKVLKTYHLELTLPVRKVFFFFEPFLLLEDNQTTGNC